MLALQQHECDMLLHLPRHWTIVIVFFQHFAICGSKIFARFQRIYCTKATKLVLSARMKTYTIQFQSSSTYRQTKSNLHCSGTLTKCGHATNSHLSKEPSQRLGGHQP